MGDNGTFGVCGLIGRVFRGVPSKGYDPWPFFFYFLATMYYFIIVFEALGPIDDGLGPPKLCAQMTLFSLDVITSISLE